MASVTPSIDADPMVAPPLDPVIGEMRETKLFASCSFASVLVVSCVFVAFATEDETHDLSFFSRSYLRVSTVSSLLVFVKILEPDALKFSTFLSGIIFSDLASLLLWECPEFLLCMVA